MLNSISSAMTHLRRGGVIAFPTEGVYGLGCDPLCEKAVLRLLKLKQRSIQKGLILIASNWQQISPFIDLITTNERREVERTWPGPVTWVFPAAATVPSWVCGAKKTVAIRMTAHPIASAICEAFEHAIVATSANIAGQPPARSPAEVMACFDGALDFIVEGPLGELGGPTPIRDVRSGKVYRG